MAVGDPELKPGPEETLDTLFGGRLQLLQPEHGYRFSVDAVLLADFARPKVGDRVVDLGAGCGVVSLILAMNPAPSSITGIEFEPGTASLASRNVRLNAMESRVRMVTGDIAVPADHFEPESFDLAVSNPPFGSPASGRTSPKQGRAAARHEIHSTLEDFLKAAAFLVRYGGRLALIYRSAGLPRLFRGLETAGFTPKRMRFVHGRLRSPGKLALVQAVKGGGEELFVEPPLVLYREDGSYTVELESLYSK
jgi:tRNA1Val (adenine37-N6)-methyltransferase